MESEMDLTWWIALLQGLTMESLNFIGSIIWVLLFKVLELHKGKTNMFIILCKFSRFPYFKKMQHFKMVNNIS